VVPRRRRWPSVVVDVARGRSAVRHHSEGRRRRRHNHLADESARRPDPVRHSAHPNGISIGSADFAGLTVAVQTQYGRLRGVLVSIADPTSSGQPARRVEVYLGLQYASLLGGRLRFMPPTGPMEKWDGGPQRSILARIFSSSRPCLVSGDNISTRCASV